GAEGTRGEGAAQRDAPADARKHAGGAPVRIHPGAGTPSSRRTSAVSRAVLEVTDRVRAAPPARDAGLTL
ncbi:hypothetical protein, partial [Streptomyces luteogriseus]|uniref:hypothetical protein n=1 Tax=Streptomyces luteogriseus TaxID=68233 RepID=UPI002633C2B1